MTSQPLLEGTRLEWPDVAPESLDTVRALCHDLRQPLAAIRLMAAVESGDVRHQFDAILEQAQWLTDLVEEVIGDAAGDRLARVDVVELVSRCVVRAQQTASSEIGFVYAEGAVAVAAPVALGRAVGCVLDNAVRAAGDGGRVDVEVTRTPREIIILVNDDGPGLGRVPTENSLGLTITRALISACRGGFELKGGTVGGAVARIAIPRLDSFPVSS
jgi:K+-sensing histidine kinase KdpD